MTIPIAHPKLLLGLHTEIKGNAQFITEEEVFYPVGNVMALHNYTQCRQKILKLPDKTQPINMIVISPNRKIIAICEKGDRPCITLYDSSTLKRKKTLVLPVLEGQHPPPPGAGPREFASVAFTYDSKTLIGVTSDPDWMMYCYNWDKGKVETSCKATNSNGTGTVIQVCTNPTDAATVCLVGDGLLRLLTCADSVWRQWGYSKAEQLQIKAAAWINADRVIAGLQNGKFYLIQSGELRGVVRAWDIIEISFKQKEDQQISGSATAVETVTSEATQNEENYAVRIIVPFTKGFVYTCANGIIHLFEKYTNYSYRKRNIFKVPEVTFREGPEYQALTMINCISVNPKEERFIVTTKRTQIYQAKLWGPDLNASPEIQMSPLGMILHHGNICALAVCAWKPIFMTCGEEDRTVRIWNYQTQTLSLCKQYNEDVHGLALHPSALYAVIAFSDKLRYMTITLEDFVLVREFAIRNCKTIQFSTMGHMLAAVNGNVIQIFSCISFQNVYNLKGHNGKIQALSWSMLDSKLISCGSEGAVYEWNIAEGEGKRCGEFVTKICSYTDASVTTDGKFTYAIGTDGQIKQISDSTLMRNVSICAGSTLYKLCLSRSDLMLFVTGPSGSVYSVKIPLLEAAEYNEYKIHRCVVNQMKLSYNDTVLITTSPDGLIAIWTLMQTDGKTVKMDKEFAYCTDILISHEELEDKVRMIRELSQRMNELQTEHTYQLRIINAEQAETIKQIHEKYGLAIDELRDRNEQLEADHIQEINNINLDIGNMKIQHEIQIQKSEALSNEKLIGEYDKYSKLEDKLANVRKSYDTQLEDLADLKDNIISNLTQDFNMKLKDKETQIEELVEELKQTTSEHETIKQQIEDDADREIFELKTKHESLIREEQETNMKLRGETGVMKKKFLGAQKEIDELKHTVHTMEGEHIKFKEMIATLEKDISDLKKEILARDSTIQDKEKKILDLKRKNQELEKFKFVLNFKIEELKGQIEPKDHEIRKQKDQITDMVNELESLQKIILSLELQLTELKEKLICADREYKCEQEKVRQCRSNLRKMKTDLHELSGLIQEPMKLKRMLKEMYHKYNEDQDFKIAQVEDTEARNEFMRQREYLERTVRGLKHAISRPVKRTQTDKSKIIEENAILISETNNLRCDLKNVKKENKKLESVIGLNKRNLIPVVAQSKKEIHNQYINKIEDLERNIATLKEENERLLLNLTDPESMPEKNIKIVIPEPNSSI